MLASHLTRTGILSGLRIRGVKVVVAKGDGYDFSANKRNDATINEFKNLVENVKSEISERD